MPDDLSRRSKMMDQTRVRPEEILAVIPALNEARHIETCVRRLMTGSAALRQVRLIVADGGSIDATRDIVERLKSEFPNLSLIHNRGRLQSAAINAAAESETVPSTRFLVRCDAHSLYHPDFILQVAKALQETGAASVVIPMDAVGETCFQKANAWIVDTPLGSGGSAHRGGRKSGFVDHGHHAGFDLGWFRKIGGYDPTFSHNEDAEYDERLRKAGGRIWLDADIRIDYIPRASVSALARQYFNYGKGRARTVQKHRRRLRIRQAIPVLALLANLIGLISGFFWWPFWIIPTGYLATLGVTSLIICGIKRSACGLWAGPASGTMHMAWAAGYIRQSFSPAKRKNA